MRTSEALVEKWLFHNRQIPVWLSRHRNRHLMWVFTGGITQRSPFLHKLFVCSGQLMVFWQHQTMIEVLVCLSFLAAVHISFPINFTVFKKTFFFVCFTEWRSELSARSHGCPGWHPGRRDIFAKFTCFFFHELLNLLLVIVALFYVSIVFGQFNIQAASHRDHFLPKWRETPHPHRVPELLK